MSLPTYPKYKDSGVASLGKVPAHWEVLPLGRISTDRCDGPFGSGIKSEHYTGQGALVVRLQNIRAGIFSIGEPVFLDQAYFDAALRGHEVLEGDVLVAGLGDDNNLLGRACVAPGGLGSALVKADCFRFRLDSERALPSFVATQLSAGASFDAGMLATGTTRSRIPLGVMATRKVALPGLSEQTSIAAFLDHETGKIDALITEQEKLLTLLAEKRQAAISHAVTRGLNPDAPKKDSTVAWLGEVPAHWNLVRLAHLFREVNEAGDESLPILSVSIHDGVSDKELNDEELDRKVTRSEDRSKYKKVARGDLVYNMMRAWQGGFGTVLTSGMVSPAYVVARPIGSEFLTSFVEQLLRTPQGVQEMKRYSRGITDFRLRLYWDEFKNIRIALPPLHEQERIIASFDEVAAYIDGLAQQAMHAIDLLKERRSALIAAAVTGKIDVREAVISEELAA